MNDDYFLCFFAFFFDWVSLFWADLARKNAENLKEDHGIKSESKSKNEGKKESQNEVGVPAKESSVRGAAVEKKGEDIELKVSAQ